jgi:hypothetical protein
MPTLTREVRPFHQPRKILADGLVLAVPHCWDLLPPGDAALSRRIKADGPTWTVIELKGPKRFSRGIWAPAERIAALRAALAAEREAPSYQRKLDSSRARRAAAEEIYAEDFRGAVLAFLSFHPDYQDHATAMATRIASHATPVGSGTVARTQRIPIEQRAEAATIAWMRHQTTGYDQMTIPRERDRRREVRRQLAARSKQLLALYRTGHPIDFPRCPLHTALLNAPSGNTHF